MEISVEIYQQLMAENERLRVELKYATQKIQYLLQKLFGAKSEKLSPDQLALLFEQTPVPAEVQAEVDEVECTSRKRGKRTPRAERMPADLPVEEVVIEPAEVQAQPEAYQRIGEEVTEELDVTPAKFFKRRIIRPKYIKTSDRRLPPVVAPAPMRVIPNSFASVGLLTTIILGKYSDHLPLYRQEQIYQTRYRVLLSRKTMCGWVWEIAHQLAMIYEALRDEIRTSGYLQADETPVDYQDPGRGRCGQGYLWAYRAGNVGVLFEWFASRASNCLTKMLKGYEGLLQTDGYAGYEAFYRQDENRAQRSKVVLAACWAHVRRKFFDAREESPVAAQVLADIQRLYGIERALREQKADASTRRSQRQEKSVPVLQQIERTLKESQAKHLPQSLTSKAIGYTLELWDRLTVYTEYGQMEIDNNLVENAIRPTAVGKKNWLFFGSAQAGQTSAILFSLIGTCRMLDINPQEYLLDVLPRLPKMTNQTAHLYTPAKWKASRLSSTG
jgi:transposase